MSRLTKILIGVGAVVVLLAALAVGGWYLFLKSDPEPPAEITKTTTVGGGTLDGTYRAAPGDANSFVGYRVTEQLVGGASNRPRPAAPATSRARSPSRARPCGMSA